MIARVLMSRSVLLLMAAVSSLVAISVIRLTVAEPGIMLLAVVPIALFGMMYGVRGGLAAAAAASAVFLVWASTRGHPSALGVIEEPVVFFVLGLVTGIYAKGALGTVTPATRYSEPSFAKRFSAARWSSTTSLWHTPKLGAWSGLRPWRSAWGDIAADVTISINVSPISLSHRDLAGEFSRVIEKHGFPASRLAVEVTETALATNPGRAVEALESLNGMGMTIVLDDFGTGHSSISRLGRLAIDELKLDLNLIGPPSDPDAHRILVAIIEMSRALGLQVVAEWVEDEETWDELTRMGCDVIQGSRLSPPLPADQVQGWLQRATQSSIARTP